MKNMNPSWRTWLRAAVKDPWSCKQLDAYIGTLPPLAALTGQDARVLEAIAACWDLYMCSDDDGQRGALAAVRALLPALQPKCRPLAAALIARSMDWTTIDRVWPLVSNAERVLAS